MKVHFEGLRCHRSSKFENLDIDINYFSYLLLLPSLKKDNEFLELRRTIKLMKGQEKQDT